VTEGVAWRPACRQFPADMLGYCAVMEEECGKVTDGWNEGNHISKAQSKPLELIIHALYQFYKKGSHVTVTSKSA
jgi:hypothetical protein